MVGWVSDGGGREEGEAVDGSWDARWMYQEAEEGEEGEGGKEGRGGLRRSTERGGG